MKVYVHRGYLCLKFKLYKYIQQIILHTFSLLGGTIKIFNKTKKGAISGISAIRSSVSGIICLFYYRKNGLVFLPTNRNRILSSLVRTSNFRYEIFFFTFFPRKGPLNRGALLRAHEGLLKQIHLHNLLAAKLLPKLVQLLSFCHPNIPVYRNSFISIKSKKDDKNVWRPVFRHRTDVPPTNYYSSNRKANDKRFVEDWRRAIGERRNAGKHGQLTENKGQLTQIRGQFTFFENRQLSTLMRWARMSIARFFSSWFGWDMRALKPFTIYLLPLKILFCVCLAHAGQRGLGNPAATGVALPDTTIGGAIDLTSQGIKIGEKVPNVLIENIHNYSSNKAQISSFHGKLLILDFWATWCSPCVGMIPKMDSLQQAFNDKLQFLSVTYQKEAEVLPFMDKLEKQHGRTFSLPIVTADNKLRMLFPHRTLPHYVWIDRNGTVVAITDANEIKTENITKALKGGKLLAKKEDSLLPYDVKKPLLINGNGGDGQNILYHSLLTSYNPFLPSGYDIMKDGEGRIARIAMRNYSLTKLYEVAYREEGYFGKNRVLLNVHNKGAFFNEQREVDSVWLPKYAYCYEILSEIKDANVLKLMREDLKRLFSNYEVQIKNLKRQCLVLKAIGNTTPTQPKGEKPSATFSKVGAQLVNYPIMAFVSRLNIIFMQHLPYPVLNETGLDRVSLKLDTNLSNWQELNVALAHYGLELRLAKRKIKMLVITDAK